MQKKLAESIRNNNASFILRNLRNLFQKNKDLPDYNNMQIEGSILNQSGLYLRQKFYKKISKF